MTALCVTTRMKLRGRTEMKGATLARKARKAGYQVATSDGGRCVIIRNIHRTHGMLNSYDRDNSFRSHDDGGQPCGHSVHIYIYCDDEGNVQRITKSTHETIRDGDPLCDLS